MMYDIKPNRLKNPWESRNKIIEDNKDLAEASANAAKNDDYVFYPGAYNGPMNKMPDIKKGKPAERPEEEDYFKGEDFGRQDDDYKDANWEKDFITSFAEENGLTPRQQRQNQTGQGVKNTYNFGEEWLMSESEKDLLSRAMINNFRSALGGTVEDFAKMMQDFVPDYKPAKTVLENRTAGRIDDMAARQFRNLKKTGAYSDRFIDYADMLSQNMGYNIFGFKAGNYMQGAGEGFDEYERLRNLGYSKEEALAKALGKGGYAIASTKVDDYIGKNNNIDVSLSARNNINRKIDPNPPKWYNRNKITNQEFKRLESALMTNYPNARGPVRQILDNENGDPAFEYEVFINDDGSWWIMGKYNGKNIHGR